MKLRIRNEHFHIRQYHFRVTKIVHEHIRQPHLTSLSCVCTYNKSTHNSNLRHNAREVHNTSDRWRSRNQDGAGSRGGSHDGVTIVVVSGVASAARPLPPPLGYDRRATVTVAATAGAILVSTSPPVEHASRAFQVRIVRRYEIREWNRRY